MIIIRRSIVGLSAPRYEKNASRHDSQAKKDDQKNVPIHTGQGPVIPWKLLSPSLGQGLLIFTVLLC